MAESPVECAAKRRRRIVHAPPREASARRRGLRHRHFWCVWRSDQAPGHAGAVQPGAHQGAAGKFRPYRRGPWRSGTAESWATHLHDMLESFVGNASLGVQCRFDRRRMSGKGMAAQDVLRPRRHYQAGALYHTLAQSLETVAEKQHHTGGNAIFYLAVGDRFFGDVVDQVGTAGLADQQRDENGTPKHWRRVVIEKTVRPRSGIGQGAECAHFAHPERRSDLPHRPFPGQGNGAEYHGVPFWQRAVRAAVEPGPYRPRADHRGGNRGRGAAAAHFTKPPARCATWCPTMYSACSPWWPWSRRRRSMRPGIRNRKAEVFTSMPPLTPDSRGARPVWRRQVAGKDVQGVSRRAACGPAVAHRNLRGPACGNR